MLNTVYNKKISPLSYWYLTSVADLDPDAHGSVAFWEATKSKAGSGSASKSKFRSFGCSQWSYGGTRTLTMESWSLKIGSWRVCSQVVADLHHSTVIRIRKRITVKRGIRIQIRITVFRIRNTAPHQRVVGAFDCQRQSRNSPGFDLSILRLSGI